MVKEQHPDQNYSEVYHKNGLLNEKTIMAHGVYLDEAQIQLFQKTKASVSHCPISNFAIHSGILDLKNLMENNITVGLGTDISGGYSPSILQVAREAIIASNTLEFSRQNYKPLNWKTMFALATLGGAETIGMADKLGSFEKGKFFDAVVVNPYNNEAFDLFGSESVLEILQKFFYLGDDRNIEAVYVSGREANLNRN